MASGLGRGGRAHQLAEALLRLKKLPGADEEDKEEGKRSSVATPPSPPPSMGGRLKSSSSPSSQITGPPEQQDVQPGLVTSQSSVLQPTVPLGQAGRGFLLRSPSEGSSSAISGVQSSSISLEQLQISPTRVPVSKHGDQGAKVPVVANYIRLRRSQEFGVFQYSVTFNPQIDGRGIRIKLVRAQEEIIGKVRSYNGDALYLPVKINVPELTTTHPVDGSDVTIYINCVGKKEDSDCIQFYNSLFKRIMCELKLTRIGRNYYDSKGGIPIPQHKLEIWPGYVTAVAEQEGGLMLTCDVSHKILRKAKVSDILYEKFRQNPQNVRAEVEKAVIGCIVMTKYNNKTYRIDEIQWNSNPKNTFQDHTGKEITFVDYYKKAYDIDIQNLTQPLLLHRQKAPRGAAVSETRLISLIPELSHMTGLTDDMTSDYRVMKDVAAHTRLTPSQRHVSYRTFLQNIRSSPGASRILADWGLSLDDDLIRLEARIAQPERIILGNNRQLQVDDRCDWTKAATSYEIFNPVDIRSWSLIYWVQNAVKVSEFAQMMAQVCRQMGINLRRPRIVELRNDRTDSYLRAIQEQVTHGSERCQIVVTICPRPRDDRYAAIKKKCYVELAVPSQVINLKTISMPYKLKSITQKVALQMNCKVGGELWAVNIPLKSIMVVGIDVHHDSSQRGRSVVGFVSSLNFTLTRWHSKTIFQSTHQELIDGLQICMIAALKNWHEINHCLPTKIFVYRDGVGDGQLSFVTEYEVVQLADSFKTFGEDYQPKLTVIVVQKRINTRIMQCEGNQFCNAAAGTILDHTVTRYNWYDFFLVSQHVNQGTVTPTHYIVIRDDCSLRPDNMQRLTYKMTHMYYNWPGTIRVPAPCQYAHKLAQMTGQHLGKNSNDIMSDRLFFL